MKVELVAMTRPIWSGSEDASNLDVVERAASVCYDSEPTENHRIAKNCMKSGHISTWEHISFTFHISGISRACLAQLSRHRHISLSCRSQRFCEETEINYVEPYLSPTQAENFQSHMKSVWKKYKLMLSDGVPAEDARAILPNACCTELYMTANARALIEMSRLRLCSRAQQEIRQLFLAMKWELKKFSPVVASYMVPSCEVNADYPFCPEAKSCGRHPKLKEVYKNG